MQYIVKKSVRLHATPAQVWDALTNPEKTKKYFFNCKVFSDWKKHSPIRFMGRIFLIKKIEMEGIILEAEPHKMLQYTIRNKDNSNDSFSTVTDTISFENGETVLSVSDNVGSGDGAMRRYLRSVKGWDKILSGLKTLVEKV